MLHLALIGLIWPLNGKSGTKTVKKYDCFRTAFHRTSGKPPGVAAFATQLFCGFSLRESIINGFGSGRFQNFF